MQRRRVAPLEVMRVIPEQEYGIAHPCEINHPHLKKGSRTFYSNPWFFYKKKQRRMDVVLLFLSVAYSIIALEKMRCSMMTSNKHPTRPPIHYSFPFAHVDKTLSRFQRDSPDYGGIAFSSLQNASHFRRKISPKNAKTFERNRQQAMTDEHSVAEKQVGHNCRQPSWQSHFYPTCNVMHEGDYIADDSSVQIGNGYYREAWLVNSTQPLIVKALKMKHDINDDTVHQVIQDAVIMEHLSPSPRIMDMYSLCGTSLVVKSMPVSVEKQIVPPGTWDATNEPRNDLSPSTKLAMALEMAESLADLHGFRQGVIVHGDVQLGQWLQESSNGTLVLGDFNLARVLGWDETKQRYCKYKVGRGHGNVSRLVRCFVCILSVHGGVF